MVDGPITDMQIASQLQQIQSQLAVLETSYANMTRTYYDMFYNTTPMDITLQIFDDEGILKTITVPNRAKSAAYTKTYNGDPSGVVEGILGAVLLNTVDKTLWYFTDTSGKSGWVKVATEAFLSNTYLTKDGDGYLLKNLNATEVNQGTAISVAHGGTGVWGTSATTMSGMLKMIPETDETPAHVVVADKGVDYIATDTLAGMIVFFPVDYVPAGYLVCNGDMISKDFERYPEYKPLYNYLTKEGTVTIDGETEDEFPLPDLGEVYIKCTTNFLERRPMSVQAGGVPNFKGNLSMEITGGEANFKGAIKIVRDDDNNYKQVDGKSSAPAGSYDYLIEFNPQNYKDGYDEIYRDDYTTIEVNNVALVPAIKI